jgi:threonine dehydrogenase-like Zn-dependent dehydrogenase
MADRLGATVYAFSRRRFSREVAVRMGAKSAHGVDDAEDRAATIQDQHGRLCDVVIEAAGAQQALDAATTLTRVRGRLVVAGYHQDGPRTVNMQLWNWRGIDVINAHERDPERYVSGMRRAIAAMADGELDPGSLHTHAFPLEKLNEAMPMLHDRPDGFVKAIVRPGMHGGDA